MGIDNRRVYGVALGIAVLTVALAGVLMGAQSSFDPFIGPSRLIYAFEAVIIGGLGSLWGTLAGRIALGVAQALGREYNSQWGELTGHAVFLAVLATGRPACSARSRHERDRVRDRRAFVVRRSTTASRIFGVAALVAIVVLALLPTFAEASTEVKMVELLTLVALAQMWNLLAGFAGVVSVGQQAFVGLGAYGMIVFVNNQGFNLYLSVVISTVLAMIVSIPMGLIAFRCRELLRDRHLGLRRGVQPGHDQQHQRRRGERRPIKVTDYDLATRHEVTYWLALVAGVGAIVFSYVVLRSRLGLRMQAIRDNEAGARARGRTCIAPGSRSGRSPRSGRRWPPRRSTWARSGSNRPESVRRSASCNGPRRSSSSS